MTQDLDAVITVSVEVKMTQRQLDSYILFAEREDAPLHTLIAASVVEGYVRGCIAEGRHPMRFWRPEKQSWRHRIIGYLRKKRTL